ncbi:hypothetical protein SteCoe_347 [Stentor coeruleus]|uniref:ATP-dependent DNA ligase family profile domain-containing protein n=1 Tax=Stentor coeruleus TaxID=5963 RepID=A0A1R2D4H7_9CILI|nr:hypothetical protein SteCoe_347 [Stentor coeruleus]
MDSDVEIIETPQKETKKTPINSSMIFQNKVRPQEDELPKKRRNVRVIEEKTPIPEIIPLLLAKNLKNEDPKGWWMSEKLDGVRCYWNGKNFISRQGNIYTAPPFFIINLLDSISLDGELWLGRKMFQECVSIARCTDNGKNDMSRWSRMKYMIFDAPFLELPFEDRMEFMKTLTTRIKNPYIKLVEQTLCTGQSHMLEELAKIEEMGGEGLMLRKPQSYYENKRSSTLLKVKTFSDAEAEVIGYEEGKGKYEGQIGALKVRNDDGKEFKIGSGLTDVDRIDPPKIGSIVTYKYQELSKDGIPRFPTYFRKRIDI